MNKSAFTICAKNYLAQAITLKETFKKHNPEIDFYIFLSDLDVENVLNDKIEIIKLDDNWIEGWQKMAFKYNIIEFSTSIKPFCFKKLFKEGYDSVIYLDPDIYVADNLIEIYNYLEIKTIVLTPHYCNIQTNFTGSVPEEEILFVGIYNLGFVAINNNETGRQIIDWWMNRLKYKCYADKEDALHVDQKWMDFIPAFFPEETLITHHMGINPAIWNLHERELLYEDNKYKIKNLISNKTFPLLFFHFSGFDPFNPKLINRRHPKYNTDSYPTYKPIFDDYVKDIYNNGYNIFSKMTYSFNSFDNGENILPVHRRLFRIFEKDYNGINPFSVEEDFISLMRKNKLLSGINSNAFTTITSTERSRKGIFEKMLFLGLKMSKIILGIRYYSALIIFLNENTRLEKQFFLLKQSNAKNK